MSQANWSDFIQSHTVVTIPDRHRRPPLRVKFPGWLTDWETWLTFALVLVVFLSVAHSIDHARWVAGMPSLTLLGFLGLAAGLLLARVRAPEIVLHLLALILGAGVVFWLTLHFIGAPDLKTGTDAFRDRWADWIHAVRAGDPVTDNMPFVMLVLAFAWAAAYLSAWSIFRWRNAWLALIPGGIALLTNISYLPSQFSADFVVFLFGGMLLVMRVHMQNKLAEWRRTGTPYPDFLSLRLLNVTTWVALAAIIVAWSVPQANEISFFSHTWERISAPFTGDSDQFVRLFSSIDSKREVPLHAFGDTLPLQGRVVLSSKIAAQVELPDGAGNPGRPVRLKVYDTYTPGGWKDGPRQEHDVPAGADMQGAQRTAYKDRVEVQATFVMESGFPKNDLPTIGQPLQASVESRAEVISPAGVPDIDSIQSRQKFKVGDTFTTVGTISTAPEDKLRAASGAYPDYVQERYLQLPDSLPQRVRDFALDLTKDRPTPYDKAKAIEEYLRTFPPSYDIPTVPPGRDSVDYFLFDEKKGYSDYQSSAMVVLLRAAGVPARLAVGYTLAEDQFDQSVHRYLLREQNAYAWPEVFFPGYGWVEFSPYGNAPVITRPASDGTAGDTAVSDPSIGADIPGLDFGDIEDPGIGSTPIVQSHSNPFRVLLPVLYGLMGLLVVGAVAGIGVRFAWERGMSGLDYPAQLWEKTIRLATWLRLGPKPHQTPSEYSRSLKSALPAATAGVDVLADSYLRSRYGRRDLSPAERERLDAAWTPLRNRLIKRVLRWK